MGAGDIAALISAGVASTGALLGTAIAVYRHIDSQSARQDASRERLRADLHGRFDRLEAKLSQLAGRDELTAVERRAADATARLADRVQHNADRLEVISGLQSETRLNSDLLRELLRAVGSRLGPTPAVSAQGAAGD